MLNLKGGEVHQCQYRHYIHSSLTVDVIIMHIVVQEDANTKAFCYDT